VIDFDLMIHNLCIQGFHIWENFLDLKYYESLCESAETLHQNKLFNKAKIGRNVQAQFNSTIRTDKIFWIDEDTTDPAIQAYLKQLNLIANNLNQHLYLGLAEFEHHFAAYSAGSFYKKHIDQFSTNKTRKISCVYYLNKGWRNEFGGELKLYNNDEQLIQSILPLGNRFICFNSELPHEVCLTHQPRLSIAGWMKTRPLLMI
jgi:SM-20-related protein